MPAWPRIRGKREKLEAKVRIQRPKAEIFEFYRDLTNLPLFLGDVMSVEPTGSDTWRWVIQGPARVKIRWDIKVVEENPNTLIRYETTTLGGLDTVWNVYFDDGDTPGSTDVREVMEIPLGRIGKAGLALMGKPPAEEMAANLRRLKQLMETGHVTETSHAVPGKFTTPAPEQHRE